MILMENDKILDINILTFRQRVSLSIILKCILHAIQMKRNNVNGNIQEFLDTLNLNTWFQALPQMNVCAAQQHRNSI